MSEFKYACPVCGQHMKCDSSQSGSVMECPTCFQKITVPQAPAEGEQKFILSGTKVGSRSGPSYRPLDSTEVSTSSKMWPAVIVVLVLVMAAAVALFAFRGRIFHRTQGAGAATTNNTNISEPVPLKHGAIGLGTWNTQVEYSNVVVTQGKKVLYISDFSAGTSGWKSAGGTWVATNGVLRQISGNMDCRAVAGDAGWSDYTLSARARKLGGQEGFLILFNVVDGQNWTWWNIGGWGNTRQAIENCVAGNKSTLDGSVAGRVTTGQWYDLRVELKGPSIRCYLNDALILDATYPASP